MADLSRLLREAYRCVQAGPSLGSKLRRLAFPPLRMWLTNPKRALLFVAVRPYTMLPRARLVKLAELADKCNRQQILGAFVQCGVWKGGSAAVLEDVAVVMDRPLYLFDSFQGCPAPGPYDISMHGRNGQEGEACASIEEVGSLLQRLRPLCKTSRFYAGWFSKIVPLAAKDMGPIALLHLDADWYESTKICMEQLYPRVVSGGYVYVDDMGYWGGAAKAIKDYFQFHHLEIPELTWVDHTGAFWKKP